MIEAVGRDQPRVTDLRASRNLEVRFSDCGELLLPAFELEEVPSDVLVQYQYEENASYTNGPRIWHQEEVEVGKADVECRAGWISGSCVL